MTATANRHRDQPSGLAFGFFSFAFWGLSPLYFVLLASASSLEVAAIRAVSTLLICLLVVTITRGWVRFVTLIRDRRSMTGLGLASLALAANWLCSIYAMLTGHVVESALGQFIAPFLISLAGVVVLRERPGALQAAAIAISGIAIVVMTVGTGSFPWLAIGIAVTWTMYSILKRGVGGRVDAFSGLTIEAMWIAPVAISTLAVLGATGGLTFGREGAGHDALLLGTGLVTAIPLLTFAASARRLRLTTLGMLNYLVPILHFVVGVVVLGEPMPLERWIGFALVWVAVIIFTIDMVRTGRGVRRASVEPL